MTHTRSPAPAGPSTRWPVAVALIATFLVTRLVSHLLLRLEAVAFVANDVSYYGYHLFRLDEGESGVMTEYPVPAVWILQAVYRLGGGWQTWTAVYVGVFVLLDAAVALTLYRRDNAAGALFWILFTGIQGPIVWFRFDLIPAALVAWACVFVTRFPKLAGGLIGLGAAIKLWPALLIGPMLAPHPWRSARARGRVIGFAVVGFGLALASLITSGWARSASPVTWQGERGLQIESVPASPLMFLRTFTDNPSWNIFLSPYNALELQGPYVSGLLTVSTVLTALSLTLAGYLSYRLMRHDRGQQDALAAVHPVAGWPGGRAPGGPDESLAASSPHRVGRLVGDRGPAHPADVPVGCLRDHGDPPGVRAGDLHPAAAQPGPGGVDRVLVRPHHHGQPACSGRLRSTGRVHPRRWSEVRNAPLMWVSCP